MENGSYAFICAVELSRIQLVEIENAIGIPFGIICRDEQYDPKELFTTVRKFDEEINDVAAMWGVRLIQFKDGNIEHIRDLFEGDYVNKMLIGPVSMKLWHDSSDIKRKDKKSGYIVCIRENQSQWKVITREKDEKKIMSSDEIMEKLSIEEIPEAKGQFTVRVIMKVNILGCYGNTKKRYRYILKKAERSLKEAVKLGHGPCAFEKCVKMLEEHPKEEWMEDVNEALTELIRYKNMTLKLLYEAERYQVARIAPEMPAEIQRFIQNADKLRKKLDQESTEYFRNHMKKLEDSERIITENWKLWIEY